MPMAACSSKLTACACSGLISAASLLDRGRAKAEYVRLLERLMAMAAADGLIQPVAKGWVLTPDRALPDPVPLWRALMRDLPILLPELTLLGRCGDRLAGAMRG